MLAPARPNGVVINYMLVDGGLLEEPLLSNHYQLGMDDTEYTGSEDHQYSMVVSRFQVTYFVHNCGFGIGLLTGCYDNTDIPVLVNQVEIIVKNCEITPVAMYIESFFCYGKLYCTKLKAFA